MNRQTNDQPINLVDESSAQDNTAETMPTKLSTESHSVGMSQDAKHVQIASTRPTPQLPGEDEQKCVETCVQEQDVLWGRTKIAHAHTGNAAFRRLVRKYRCQYQETKIRDEKAKIVRTIMACTSSAGGRFLKSVDDKGKIWYSVSATQTYHKVSHALRSARPTKSSTMVAAKQQTPIVAPVISVQTPVDEITYNELLERQKNMLSFFKESHKRQQEDKCIFSALSCSLDVSRDVASEQNSYDEDMLRFLGDVFVFA
jgi:osmotically-inducible protein OsmY